MAQTKEKKNDSVEPVVDGTSIVQTAQAPAPTSGDSKDGDKVKVNPALDTLTVTIPTGEFDDDGNPVFDHYDAETPYDEGNLLDYKETGTGRNLFVKV